MIEMEYDDIEKIVQHVTDTALNKSIPKTERLVAEVKKELADHKRDRDAEIGASIEKYVNGGIRKIQGTMDGIGLRLDQHIIRVEPMLKSYEKEKTFWEFLTERARGIVFWGGVLFAVGLFYVAFVYGLPAIVGAKP